MRVILSDDKISMAQAAAQTGARKINEAIAAQGSATIAVTTGLSQVDMLGFLVREDVDWSKVTAFQLDDFIGLPSEHPSSTRSFLKRNFLSKVPALGAFHAIEGTAADIPAELARLNGLMAGKRLDVGFICIGENGHLAFNDPPADLRTHDAYIRVQLSERGRKQQVNEGWFPTLGEVPHDGITMSVWEMIQSKSLIATVPGVRKARGVAMSLFDEVSPAAPCATLRWHSDCDIFLDRQSATLVYGDLRTN